MRFKECGMYKGVRILARDDIFLSKRVRVLAVNKGIKIPFLHLKSVCMLEVNKVINIIANDIFFFI